MARQIQFRRGTTADWTSSNPVLAQAELGFETDTHKFKIGDGSTAWASLSYFETSTSMSGSDIVSAINGSSATIDDDNIARTPVAHDNTYHSATYITTAGVTYEALNANSDVGTGSSQVAVGNHTHTSVDGKNVQTTITNSDSYIPTSGAVVDLFATKQTIFDLRSAGWNIIADILPRLKPVGFCGCFSVSDRQSHFRDISVPFHQISFFDGLTYVECSIYIRMVNVPTRALK